MLYRKLFARGMQFSDIQRELRCELALVYLTYLHVPLTDIALALGYSELSAFSRASRSGPAFHRARARRRLAGRHLHTR